MRLDKYAYASISNHVAYEFLSEGPKGSIKKVVIYQQRGNNYYNLAFGDWDEYNQRIDDNLCSNNNDRDKVLATVASTVRDFMKIHPDAVVFIKGSTEARTRLHQMGLIANLKEIKVSFALIGFFNGNWESFAPGKNYKAFALKAK